MGSLRLCVVWLTLITAYCTSRSKHYCELQHQYKKLEANMKAYIDKEYTKCASYIYTDCNRLFQQYPLLPSGVYTINPGDKQRSIPAYCDMTTDGGGWLVIQKRTDGLENFDKSWMDYEMGFGNSTGDFWLGNKNIHRLTSQGVELRIELTMDNGTVGFAHYDSFSVGNLTTFYRLEVFGYSGNIGDSLSSQNGMKFSAQNFDLDTSALACSKQYTGGWWFKDCGSSDLNGQSTDHTPSITWKTWSSQDFKSSTVMMIRPHAKNNLVGVNGTVMSTPATVGTTLEYQCPYGTIKWTGASGISCYTFIRTLGNWTDGIHACSMQSPGSHLFAINSKDEEDFLINIIENDKGLRDLALGAGFFTSASGQAHKRVFQWTGEGEPYNMTYTNWGPGQPNNSGGHQECVDLEIKRNKYVWGDSNCYGKHPCICEINYPMRQ